MTFLDYLLVLWSDAAIPSLTNTDYIIGLGIAALLQVLSFLFVKIISSIFAIKASRNIHEAAATSILDGSFNFFDVTPVGMILNRLSKVYPPTLLLSRIMMLSTISCLKVCHSFCGHFILVSLNTFYLSLVLGLFAMVIYGSSPFLILLIVPLLVLYFFIQRGFRKVSRELKRLELISRSPLCSHVDETMACFLWLTSSRPEYQPFGRAIKKAGI